MPVETSAAEVVRRFYDALGDRDMDAIRACRQDPPAHQATGRLRT